MEHNKHVGRQNHFQTLSLGPLYSCQISVANNSEPQDFEWQCFGRDSRGEFNLQRFIGRLQALIKQALQEGCTSKELKIIISQHNLGEHHVDA